MGRIEYILFGLVFSISGFSQRSLTKELVAYDSEVKPGGLGHIIFNWKTIKNTVKKSIVLDSNPYFTALNTPLSIEGSKGQETIVFIANPFTPPQNYQIKLSILVNGKEIGSAISQIHVIKNYAVESTVLEEKIDSIKVLHYNKGNVRIVIDNHSLLPGQSVTLSHLKQKTNELALTVKSEKWDSSYTVPLSKKIYSSETTAPQFKADPKILIRTQHRLSDGSLFNSYNTRIRLKNWSAITSLWNNSIQGYLTYGDDDFIFTLSNTNARISPLLRPRRKINFHGSLINPGLKFYLDEEAVAVSKSIKISECLKISPGFALNENAMRPTLSFSKSLIKGALNWEMIGRMNHIAWEWNGAQINYFGQLLIVPDNLLSNSIQSTSGIAGASMKVDGVRLNHQSSFLYNSSFFHMHNTHVQWGSSKLQWLARTQFVNLKDQFSGSIQGTLSSGHHNFSSRLQFLSSKRQARISLNSRYRWNIMNHAFGVAAQFNSASWNFRGQLTTRINNFQIGGEIAYSQQFNTNWFYQTSISKEADNHLFRLTSSIRFPIGVSWSGSFLNCIQFKTLKGHIENIDGKPIQDIVVSCQGKTIRSDSQGNFIFRHLDGSNVSIRIHPESLPFAKFPEGGYTHEVVLDKHEKKTTIILFSSSAVQGRLLFPNEQELTFHPVIDRDNLTVRLIDDLGTVQIRSINKVGEFYFSNLKTGRYTIIVNGLGKYFKCSPISINVREGEICNQSIQIESINNLIPFQQL